MKNIVLAIMTVILSLLISGLSGQSPLDVIYSTGVYSDHQIGILTPASGNATLYSYDNGTQNATLMQDYFSYSDWKHAAIQMPDHPWLGFRVEAEDLMVNPIFWNAAEPPFEQFTPLESDPIGDQVFTNNHLDIVSTKASFTHDKLFFALKTNGTAYPVSSGLTYFSYMIVLVDPDADPQSNPTVYGLMHTVSMGTLISPGLYKITGTGFADLTRIGNIDTYVEPTTNTLVLSCNMADLNADADFVTWFDPAYPKVITSAITSRITLSGGTQQADLTDGAHLLLLPQSIPVADLSAPVLSQAEYEISDDPSPLLNASIFYSDADANFPRHASLSIDGGEQYDLMPLITNSLDFSQPILYQCFNIPIAVDWTAITYSISHANGSVEHTVLNEVSNSDLISVPPMFSIFPNPAIDYISISRLGSGGYPIAANIYNHKGQRIREYLIEDPTRRLELGDLPSGVYFLRVPDAKGTQTQRFVKVK